MDNIVLDPPARVAPACAAVLVTDAGIRDLVGSALVDLGLETIVPCPTATRDPDRLRAFLRQHRPTVCLLGLEFPYRDGWALLEELRRHAPCRFVALTTDASPGAQAHGVQARVEVLVEPFDLDALLAAAAGGDAAQGAPSRARRPQAARDATVAST